MRKAPLRRPDLSTGNIEFEGSVQVRGNVSSNFEIRAGGNVIISGVVDLGGVDLGQGDLVGTLQGFVH